MGYKMNGFSGFGNSPAKQQKEKTGPRVEKKHYRDKSSEEKKSILEAGKARMFAWEKYNPSVKEFVKRQTTPGTKSYAPLVEPQHRTGNIDETQYYAANPKAKILKD